MRIRLLAVIGLIFALGCACGDMSEFQSGMDQALVESIQETEIKAQGVKPGPNRKAVLELCTRATVEAMAGSLELVETSVWLGEVEAAIADGEVSDEEAAALGASYEAMVAG